jgi:hypothetical protein
VALFGGPVELVTVPQKRLLAAIIVPIQIVLAALAWRDLARRTDDQVRGKKSVWRVFVSLNPGNSVIYWLFGRR